MDETQLLHHAKQAVTREDRAAARALLTQVIQSNPRSETAWLWLSAVIDDPLKERQCLERVLAINPDNQLARDHLAQLDQAQSPPPATSAAPSEPPPRRRRLLRWVLIPGAIVLLGILACCGVRLWQTSRPEYRATAAAKAIAKAAQTTTQLATKAPTSNPRPTSTPVATPASGPVSTPTTMSTPADTPPSTNTPSPTSTTPPTNTPSPTPSQADQLYAALVDRLDDDIIRGVQISGRDLVIRTALDRSGKAEWFFEDIGAIHGVVVRANPDVDRVVLDDVIGQRIIMPMEAMRTHFLGLTTFDQFRATWTVTNP